MKPRTRELEYEAIHTGDSVEFSRIIGSVDVDSFAKLSGDFNPLHIDEQYASRTQFKGRVVHGMLIASLFSTIVGTHLPGKRCLYLSQSLSFKKPVMLGTEIHVRGTVIGKVDAMKILIIKTEARNENNEILVEGEAKVKVMEDGKR